jgi:hypothetical protein
MIMAGTLFIEIIVGLALIAITMMGLQAAAVDTIIPFGLNNTVDSNARNTLGLFNTVWIVFPIIAAMGMLYMGLVRSQKEDGFQ